MEWFEQDLTTLAFLWRVERRDGIAIGFTSHDRDLWVGGLRHRAAPGMVPSALERTDSLVPDDVELAGALTDRAFRAEDLLAGRWDGAVLTLSAANWADPAAAPIALAHGSFGAVELKDGGFSVALRGSAAAFDRAIVEATSPTCRAELGDARCRVDLAGRRAVARVSGTDGETIDFVALAGADGDFAGGSLRWLDGANAGLAARIVAQAGAQVTLEDVPARPVAAGDRAVLTHGCDKRFATCGARFANRANFRGEPHLPGNDVLVRYGG